MALTNLRAVAALALILGLAWLVLATVFRSGPCYVDLINRREVPLTGIRVRRGPTSRVVDLGAGATERVDFNVCFEEEAVLTLERPGQAACLIGTFGYVGSARDGAAYEVEFGQRPEDFKVTQVIGSRRREARDLVAEASCLISTLW